MVLPWVLALLGAALAVTAMVIHIHFINGQDITTPISATLIVLVFGGVGAAIVSRVPRNAVGWIFLGLGLYAAVAGVIEVSLMAFGSAALEETGRWLGHWAWTPGLVLPLTFVLLLFPDGRFLSRRWRIVGGMAGIGLFGITANAMVGPYLGGADVDLYGPNPYHIPGLEWVGYLVLFLPVAFLGSITSLAVRYRKADSIQRQQIKWIVWSGAIAVAAQVVMWGWLSRVSIPAVIVVTWATILLIPLSIALAIRQYRLYAVDLTIKWTLRRGLVLTALAGVFFIAKEGAAFLVAGGLEARFPIAGMVPSIVAAAIVAALLYPAWRLAGRVTNRLMPDIKNTEEFRTVRKRELYEVAFRTVLKDGVVTEKERKMLSTLAVHLHLDLHQARTIEAAVQADAGGAGSNDPAPGGAGPRDAAIGGRTP